MFLKEKLRSRGKNQRGKKLGAVKRGGWGVFGDYAEKRDNNRSVVSLGRHLRGEKLGLKGEKETIDSGKTPMAGHFVQSHEQRERMRYKPC